MNDTLHFLLVSFLGGLAALGLKPIIFPLIENWLEHLPANRRKREILAQESKEFAEIVIKMMPIYRKIRAAEKSGKGGFQKIIHGGSH